MRDTRRAERLPRLWIAAIILLLGLFATAAGLLAVERRIVDLGFAAAEFGTDKPLSRPCGDHPFVKAGGDYPKPRP